MNPAKSNILVLPAITALFLLIPVRGYAGEDITWAGMVEKLQKRMDAGAPGRDISVTFQNSPYKKFMVDELIAYTIRSDGRVIIQMKDQVKELEVSPNELLWLVKFLKEHEFSQFPENEGQVPGSASFAINLRAGSDHKGIWLYNKRNDRQREIAWQYMLRLGQLFLEECALRDRNTPILPACSGIKEVEEIDDNNDGVIDWLSLKVGFHVFKAGDFIFDFSGVRHAVFMSPGDTDKIFFLNTYLLDPDSGISKDYLFLCVNSRPAYPTGAYKFDLGVPLESRSGKKFRHAANFVFNEAGSGTFPVRLRQSAIVNTRKGISGGEDNLLRFTLSDVSRDSAYLSGKDDPVILTGAEKVVIGDFGCISGSFGLENTDSSGAVFNVGWDIPEEEAIRRKMEYFQDALSDDKYQGDRETAKASFELCRECLNDLESAGRLQIDVIYSTPENFN